MHQAARATSQDAVEFAAFCKTMLSEAQALAVLLAAAESKGVLWTLPRPGLIWEALQQFAQQHLTKTDLSRYEEVLHERASLGRPLVAEALERDAARRLRMQLTEPEPLIGKPRTAGPPRSADEWVERQISKLRTSAKRLHAANQQTRRYKKLRDNRLVLAGNRCEECGSVEHPQLHHLHYATLGDERLRDVVILCDACHAFATDVQAAEKRARWKSIGRNRPRRLR
jgi:5-methylcytosine-specific restriction endonuclease McrA